MIPRKALLWVSCVLGLAVAWHYRTHQPKYLDLLSPRLIESNLGDRVPFSAQCANPIHGEFKLHSRAFSTFRIAQKHDALAHPERLAEEQLKYFRGFFHFSEIDGMRVNMLAGSKIHVVSSKRVPYPLELRLDPPELDSGRAPLSVVSQVKNGDPGYEVEYDASIPAIICQRASIHHWNLKVELPSDPYLAYWLVPKSGRRVLSWGKSKTVTNPCSYGQMAELKLPELYWYVWDPVKKGQQFDCSSLLRGNKVSTVQASFDPSPAIARDYSISPLLKPGPLRVAIIFGLLSYDQSEKAMSELKAKTADFGRVPVLPNSDPGVQIADFVANLLGRIEDLQNWKVQNDGGSFVFSTKGHLRESKRPIEIEAFLGPTVNYQKGTKHWRFLEHALETADFVFYSGHAGMGTTFTMEKLQRRTGREIAREKLPAYQFVGILSCFATDYYGQDIATLRARPGLTTDVMLSGFEGFSFMMIPAVLQYVDLSLAGHEVSLKKSMERFLDLDQPVHVERYSL